ncbi:MAG: aldo/keto reductase [Chloroflexi bacterium]|nr:aldo/keto reductase [Chloroflexota bacterium]MDA1145331.1 aldo/keto reductase [Chloroflexota bacterium]
MEIETRRIGTTEIEVTKLGLGGGSLGLGGVSDGDAPGIVDAAWAGGVRYFDTAPLYGTGRSEARVGAALSQRPRDEFVLSSKVGRLLVPGTASAVGGPEEPAQLEVRYDYSAEGVRASVEASLERLGLGRIDILLCHDIDTWTHHEGQPAIYEAARNGALRTLTELRAEGVIRAWGLGVNEWQVCDRMLDEFEPDCFLLAGRFTLLEQEPLATFLPRCVERNVSIIIGGPYNSGLLANAERGQATYDYQPVNDERWERAQRIRAICDAHGVDIRAAALQYPLRHPAVATVIPGARSVAEVTGNLGFVDAPIPDALWDDLDSAGLAPRL